jgi:hypothetical protein
MITIAVYVPEKTLVVAIIGRVCLEQELAQSTDSPHCGDEAA